MPPQRSVPHRPAAARVTGARRAVAVATALVSTAVLAGCAGQGGVRDDGVAPRLTPPASALPLWPGYTPAGERPTAVPSALPFLPVKEVSVPAGGLRDVSPLTLLERDPNMPEVLRLLVAEDCPGARCAVRKPVYRDLTGDGREELIAAVDERAVQMTMVHVYRAVGKTIQPVLVHRGQLGLTGETLGRDLVLSATGQDGQVTSRYRWNGERMALVLPGTGTGTGTSAGTDAGPGTSAHGTPGATPDGAGAEPGAGDGTGPWPTPAAPAPRTTTPP
ncbi:hypothetical protein [Streptomyces sp. NPDC018031]|uniref:hypothetical protein n=1 Tax=Streptomyces sp. NPDC018031 TaxID=3365033 RepID=UPI0037A6E5CB